MVTIRLLVVCLELITLPICSFFLSCSVHCERLVSSMQPVFIPSLSVFPGVELCTCSRSQRPEGHVGYSTVTPHFVPLRQGLFLPFSPSLSLPLLVRDWQLESPSSYPVFSPSVLGSQACVELGPAFVWVLGSKWQSSCLSSKHF